MRRGKARSSTGAEDLGDPQYLLFPNVPWRVMIEISHLSMYAHKTKCNVSSPKCIRALCSWSQQYINWNSNREWMGFAYKGTVFLPIVEGGNWYLWMTFLMSSDDSLCTCLWHFVSNGFRAGYRPEWINLISSFPRLSLKAGRYCLVILVWRG